MGPSNRAVSRERHRRHVLTPLTPNSPANFTVEHVVGRLVQTRLSTLSDMRDMYNVESALHSALTGIPGQVVICTDWTRLNVLSPEIAKYVYEMLATTNAKVLRGAILLDADKATFNLQVERVIREAGSPSRRTFRDTSTMLEWLSDVLTPPELSCAREFLNRGGQAC